MKKINFLSLPSIYSYKDIENTRPKRPFGKEEIDMKSKGIAKKLVVGFFAVTLAVTGVIASRATKVQAAVTTEGSTKIISDSNATAYINSDGSGKIVLTDNFKMYDVLESIDGIPLKEIITFHDNGYVSDFTYEDSEYLPIGGFKEIVVHAAGPKGILSGAGHLKFTDKTGDVYDLSIWRSYYISHGVTYYSSDPTITQIEWYS